jgi:hypothetical protein
MAAQTVEPWLEGRIRVAAVVTPESDSAPQHEWRHEQRSPQRELQSIHVGTDQIRIADRSSSAAASSKFHACNRPGGFIAAESLPDPEL